MVPKDLVRQGDKMKTVNIVAEFPDVLDSVNVPVKVSGEASASTLRSAVARALGSILKAPELKRKRIKTISLTIEITNKEAE